MLNNIRFIFGAISLSAAGVWMLSGSAQESYEFDLPANTVIQRLSASHRTVEGSGMGSLNLSGVSQPKAGQVKIAVTRAGNPGKVLCSIVIKATSPTSSLANLDCEQSGSDENQMKALGGEAMKIVVAEHVLASVLARPYNTDKVADQMIAFAARSAPVMVANLQPPEPEPSSRHEPRESKADAEFYGGADSADGGDSSESFE
jgi:hypothetical protein